MASSEDIDPTKLSRGERWQAIYSRKGALADPDTPLHVVGGYHMFSLHEWDAQIQILAEPLLPLPVGAALLEVGVGAGAVLDSLHRISPEGGSFKLYGMDYCASVVEVARTRIQGEFNVGDATDLRAAGYADGAFDLTLSFGVTQYLNSLDAVRAKLHEMIRVTKPGGGRVFMAEVSDLAKKDLADELRSKSHTGAAATKNVSSDAPTHLYVPKSLVEEVAAETDCSVEIRDHTALGLKYSTAPYRYSAYLVRR